MRRIEFGIRPLQALTDELASRRVAPNSFGYLWPDATKGDWKTVRTMQERQVMQIIAASYGG